MMVFLVCKWGGIIVEKVGGGKIVRYIYSFYYLLVYVVYVYEYVRILIKFYSWNLMYM